MMTSILETDRLLLRRPTIDDASFMLRLCNEPLWLRYIGDRKVYSLEDARQYLLNGSIKSFSENCFGFAVVVLKSTGVSIGSCGLAKRDFLDDVDLGFAFFPEYFGQGFAYEAAMGVIHHARNDLGMQKLVAITTKDNFASIKLLEKLGFELEKTIDVEGDELFLFASNCM